jgi:LacI family transcriptional regulator
VLLLAEERFGVVRDFLRGFYGTVRPERDWLLLQVRGRDLQDAAVADLKPDVAVLPSLSGVEWPTEMGEIPVLRYLSAVEVKSGPWFVVDERAVGRMAARHLLSAGYRHAACVVHPRHVGSRQRMEGFAQVLEEAGIRPEVFEEDPLRSPSHDVRLFTAEDPRMTEWLHTLPRSTGIYAWNDGAALWVAECAHRIHREIPVDMGLVGTDNQADLCLRAWPGLDSVMLPFAAMGKGVAEWIAAWEAGQEPVDPLPYAPSGIHRRQSTGFQSGPIPGLETLGSLLRELPVEALSVPELSRRLGVSRRTLERRVREHAGSTVHELIERRRLDLAEVLLSTTDRTMADIAEACGFATTRSLELLFRKYHATTPAAYAQLRRSQSGS